MAWQVCELQQSGPYRGKWLAVSGIGRNRRTLDTTHRTRGTAQRWARELNKYNPRRKFRVEECV